MRPCPLLLIVAAICACAGCEQTKLKQDSYSGIPAQRLSEVRLVTGDIYWTGVSGEGGDGAADILVKNGSDSRLSQIDFRLKLYRGSEFLGEHTRPMLPFVHEILPGHFGTVRLQWVDLPRNLARLPWKTVDNETDGNLKLTLQTTRGDPYTAVIELISAREGNSLD